MGLPIARLAGRAAFIGAIIAGGLLAAGIAQAQAQTMGNMAMGDAATAPHAPTLQTASDGDGQPTQADRQRELIAATGGPAPAGYLMTVASERPAVEARADDVADATPDPADALNAAEAAHDQAAATPPADASPPR